GGACAAAGNAPSSNTAWLFAALLLWVVVRRRATVRRNS
ncbi:MAG: MYXO-CTERM sorting domain-containing protein, partial [Myxococcota bacterium]